MAKFSLFPQLNIIDRALLSLILAIFVLNMLIPQTVRAADFPGLVAIETQIQSNKPDDLLTLRFWEAEKKLLPLPISNKREIAKYPALNKGEMYVTSTAYSSDPAQTDDTPCITANGYDVCASGVENVVAANFLPFGTKIKIPDLFGDRIFIVQDRMNARYTYRVDLWMTSKERAINYGIRYIRIQIVQ